MRSLAVTESDRQFRSGEVTMEFGLDREILERIDPVPSLKRIRNDLQSDFIYAPHLSAIYHAGGADLWALLAQKLRSGRFGPRLPITIEVPKASGFTRPGSILWPCERLAYQAVIDALAPVAEAALDRSVVYSNVLLDPDSDGFMFQPSGDSYQAFRVELTRLCHSAKYIHAVRADVACFFERLYQHVLVNLLRSAACPAPLVSCLEQLLLSFTQKDSHGIIQGVFPSDFLGNFYLTGIDASHQAQGIPFIRYVDDLYCFFPSEAEARKHLVTLGRWLRSDGLNLNEAKSHVILAADLLRDETEVDEMFAAAKEEAGDQLQRQDFYGSTLLMEPFGQEQESAEERNVDLAATRALFDRQDVDPKTRQKIDSFCLAVLTAGRDPYAVDYVIGSCVAHPHMAQRYTMYLAQFVAQDRDLVSYVEGLLTDDGLFEYQIMWLYALLMQAEVISPAAVALAARRLQNASLYETVRAAIAVFIGKYGSPGQRRILKAHYQNEPSAFVRAALVFAARYFGGSERNTCFAAWGGHDEVNALVVTAARKIT
jgi:hypothetical protein